MALRDGKAQCGCAGSGFEIVGCLHGNASVGAGIEKQCDALAVVFRGSEHQGRYVSVLKEGAGRGEN